MGVGSLSVGAVSIGVVQVGVLQVRCWRGETRVASNGGGHSPKDCGLAMAENGRGGENVALIAEMSCFYGLVRAMLVPWLPLTRGDAPHISPLSASREVLS